MSRRQGEFKNSFIFNKDGGGAGVWTGQGVTRTKRSRTLFVTMLPPQVQPGQVGNLFKGEPGFEDFRTRRRMCFVDFGTPIQATNAMRKFQGHKFTASDKGLAIDFDKDHVSKRNKQYERQKRKRDESMEYTYYFCTCCGTKFCSLKSAPPLDTIAKRKTDGATALKEVFLADLYAHRGERKKIKRANGTEKQYPLTCTKCGIQIAYRPVPLNQETKYCYVLADALTDDPQKRLDVGPPPTVSTATAMPASNDVPMPAEDERKQDGKDERKQDGNVSAPASAIAAAEATPNVHTLLAGLTVNDMPFSRRVITVRADQSLEEAFRIMADAAVTSVPVKQDDRWIGFIDIADLVHHVAQLYEEMAESFTNFASLRALLSERKRRHPASPNIGTTCVNVSKASPFLPVAPGASLLSVLQRLAQSSTGAQVHRVPVVDASSGRITKIVSQSAAIRFLCAHMDGLGAVADATLESLGLAHKHVVTVQASEPCLKAFTLMAKHSLSGLGIVSEEGALICSVSASDARFLVRLDKFELLDMDVVTFVAKCRQIDRSRMAKTMPPVLSVSPTATLRHVMGKLSAARVHRLYVVHRGKLCGVVSLKDILRVLVLS